MPAIVLSPSAGDRYSDIMTAYQDAQAQWSPLVFDGGEYDVSAMIDIHDLANQQPVPIETCGPVVIRSTGTHPVIWRFKPSPLHTNKQFSVAHLFGSPGKPFTLEGRVETFTATLTTGSSVITDIVGLGDVGVGWMVQDWSSALHPYSRGLIVSISGNQATLSSPVIAPAMPVTVPPTPPPATRRVTLYATPTVTGLELDSTAHGEFYVNVRDVYGSAVLSKCGVRNVYGAVVSCNRKGFRVQPATGVFLTKNAAGSSTTSCRLREPIIEGVESDGLRFDFAVGCKVDIGTSEANGGGVFFNTGAEDNVVEMNFMEANTERDVYDIGIGNVVRDSRGVDGRWLLNGQAGRVVGGFVGHLNAATTNKITDIRYRHSYADVPTTRRRDVRSGGGVYLPNQI